MKILYIIPSIEGGGAENQLRLLSNKLAESEEVWVIYLHEHADADKLFDPRVNKICLSVTNNYSFKIILEIFKYIKRLSPDIVQTWITQVDIIVGLLSYVQNFNWIVREPSDKLSRKQTIKLWLRRTLGVWRAKAVIANSARGLIYWEGTRLRSILIRNGYDLSSFYTFNHLPLHEEFKYEIISVGRLEKSKNILLLIDLIDSLPQSIKENLRLTIIGKGTLEADIITASKNISFQIRLTGYVNDKESLLKYYKNSNVYCSLSLNEGMPNTLIEAGLSRVIPIVSNIPPHLELLSEEYPFLLNLEDMEQMQKTLMNGLLLERGQAENISENVAMIFSQYSIEKIGGQYLSLYNSIISKEAGI
jgi:glycosyltransferase involved in cell wall biosynthesis